MSLQKTFPIKIISKADDGGQIVVSTVDRDRDNDRVMPAGAQLENYLKNPVVMWAHDYQEFWSTIGRTNQLTIDSNGIQADFRLRPAANDFDPQNVILLLWAGDWVRAASIGFNPWIEPGKGLKSYVENEFGGLDFTFWEFLEWSLCPIPANQNALRLAMKATKAAAPVAAGNDADPELFRRVSDLLKSGDFSDRAIAHLLKEADTPIFQITMPDASSESVTKESDGESVSPVLSDASPDPQPDAAPPAPAPSDSIAWVRRLEVEGYQGKQALLATFYKEFYTYADDAEKMTINAQGEIEYVSHPDAGKTVTILSVNYSPPLKIFDDGWGDDCIYSASWGKEGITDEELVKPSRDDEYEITLFGPILAEITLDDAGKKSLVKSLNWCRLTAKRAAQAEKQLKAGMKAMRAKAIDPTPTEIKRGRVLSAANEKLLREAQDAQTLATEKLNNVLAALPPETDEANAEVEGQKEISAARENLDDDAVLAMAAQLFGVLKPS